MLSKTDARKFTRAIQDLGSARYELLRLISEYFFVLGFRYTSATSNACGNPSKWAECFFIRISELSEQIGFPVNEQVLPGSRIDALGDLVIGFTEIKAEGIEIPVAVFRKHVETDIIYLVPPHATYVGVIRKAIEKKGLKNANRK